MGVDRQGAEAEDVQGTPGRERSITAEQAATLLGELPAHQRDVVLFALATGLRQANVLGLEWSRVDLAAGHAWVDAGQSKNRRPIAVPLNATALEVLRRQLGKHPQRVFTYAGRPLVTANSIAWRKALKRAGIENFRWHDLRHYPRFRTMPSWDVPLRDIIRDCGSVHRQSLL